MGQSRAGWLSPLIVLAVLVVVGLRSPPADSACCYFSAKDKDIKQPGQKVFITWDPKEKVESFTVQPKFEGNAADFGMVIPTPARPKLDKMPRGFFKGLAVYTVLKNREWPESKLVPFGRGMGLQGMGGLGALGVGGGLGAQGGQVFGSGSLPRRPPVKVVETGVVGSLDYKILSAKRADDLFNWLKDNRYHYAGDEAVLDHYIRKGWFFTVMKIDTLQMKRKPDGSFDGEVTPTRFQFASDQLVYPLKITQVSVKDKTEALFYVQAPHKVDLPGDMTYQYQWLPMLENARGWYQKGTFGRNELPGKGDEWLKAVRYKTGGLTARGTELGFAFQSGQRPRPNAQGRIATTLEWAKRLTAADIGVIRGKELYSERVPNVDEGFTDKDLKDPRRAELVSRVIRQRLQRELKRRPGGYLVREAPSEEILALRILAGHLKEGQFLTKLRKTFTPAEMDEDLLIVPAQFGKAVDRSEYEEILPTSPP